MVQIVKISDSEFALSGTEEVFVSDFKEIVVDGVTYVNRQYKNEIFDFDKDRIENPKDWSSFHYYYPSFGIDYKLHYSLRFDGLLKVAVGRIYSQNDWANCFHYILEKEKIPTIKWFGVKYERDNIRDFKHLSIAIPLEAISSGYYFFIETPFVEIVKMDWTQLDLKPKNYLETFFFDSKWGKEFWQDLLPPKIINQKLTLDEVNLVLMELYQRKVNLFTRAARIYKHKENKNNYILKNLNKSCYL